MENIIRYHVLGAKRLEKIQIKPTPSGGIVVEGHAPQFRKRYTAEEINAMATTPREAFEQKLAELNNQLSKLSKQVAETTEKQQFITKLLAGEIAES